MEHKTNSSQQKRIISKYATNDKDIKKAADRIVDYIVSNYGDLLKRLAKE